MLGNPQGFLETSPEYSQSTESSPFLMPYCPHAVLHMASNAMVCRRKCAAIGFILWIIKFCESSIWMTHWLRYCTGRCDIFPQPMQFLFFAGGAGAIMNTVDQSNFSFYHSAGSSAQSKVLWDELLLPFKVSSAARLRLSLNHSSRRGIQCPFFLAALLSSTKNSLLIEEWVINLPFSSPAPTLLGCWPREQTRCKLKSGQIV